MSPHPIPDPSLATSERRCGRLVCRKRVHAASKILLFLAVFLLAAPRSGRADVTPAAGYQTAFVSPLTNAYSFQSFLGAFDANGNLVLGTRDAIHPAANHRILSVAPDGVDSILSTAAQYPPPDRLLGSIRSIPGDPGSMFILDGGSYIPCDASDDDGRLLQLDLQTGAIVSIASGGLYDTVGMDRDPISGNLYLADKGCSSTGVPPSGMVHVWDGNILSTTSLNIQQADDLVFLSDGTYYFIGADALGNPGIFHVSGDTVVGTYATLSGIGGRLAIHDGSGAMPAGVYASVFEGGQAKLLWLPDADGDFVADQVVSIATGNQSFGFGGIVFDAQGRLLVIDQTVMDLIAISTIPIPAPLSSPIGLFVMGILLCGLVVASLTRHGAARRIPF